MKKVLAVLLLCVVVIANGCKKGERAMAPKQKPITISLDASGNIVVTPEHQDIYPDEEAVWLTSPAGTKFHVKFKDKTPFANGDFDEGNPNSGKPTVTVTQPTPYAYSVRYRDKFVDPDVIIKPTR